MERRRHALIGSGRLAQALGPALAAAGELVVAVGSRRPAQAQTLADALGCALQPPALAAQSADWVWLCVPDDVIADVAGGLPWRAGQVALHGSGATPLSALDAAQRAGAAVAGFHPLQLLPGGAVALRGCGVGVQAPDAAVLAQLQRLAADLGLQPLTLDTGSRPLYHAGANLAASGVLAVLAQALAAWRAAGIECEDGLALLRPLVEGSLRAAQDRGLAAAVSGPVARGDAGVLAGQLQSLAQISAEHAELYRLLGRQQQSLAESVGRLTPEQRTGLRRVLGAD